MFVSSDFATSDKLLVIINGGGGVRAGQWARALIINEGLDEGSQVSFIEEGKRLGYGIVVLNTNENNKDFQPIPQSETPERHATTAWRDYIQTAKATRIVVVAHSYGGMVTVELAIRFLQDFYDRVGLVLLTDSSHTQNWLEENKAAAEHLKEVGVNFVRSDLPAGSPIESTDIRRLSSGHALHEWTSWSARSIIFQRLKEFAEEGDKTNKILKKSAEKGDMMDAKHAKECKVDHETFETKKQPDNKL